MNAFYTQYQSDSEMRILDVREEHEYGDGHIEGAILFPLSEVVKRLDELDSEEHYYLICRSAQRSKVVGKYLAEQGYNVTDVEGGMLAWEGDMSYGIQPEDRKPAKAFRR